MTVSWPEIDGMGELICEGFEACLGVVHPQPPTGVPFEYTCNATSVCATRIRDGPTSKIYCPRDAPCTITCIQAYSCDFVCTLESLFFCSHWNLFSSFLCVKIGYL